MHNTPQTPARILITKVGLDGHESSAKLIALLLRDAGYEVIYGGPRQTPEVIVWTAEQEDVDLIGVSLLSGTHMVVARRIIELLRDRNRPIPVLMGGIIPPRDHEPLIALGVAGVFGPGSSTSDILKRVSDLVGVGAHGAGASGS